MSFNAYLKVYNHLVSTRQISLSKKKLFKQFLINEYKLSIQNKKKLKIGQLKFQYNPLTYDNKVVLHKFDLKTPIREITESGTNRTWIFSQKLLMALTSIIFLAVGLKSFGAWCSMYLAGTLLPEVNTFLFDCLFPTDENELHLPNSFTQILQTFLF